MRIIIFNLFLTVSVSSCVSTSYKMDVYNLFQRFQLNISTHDFDSALNMLSSRNKDDLLTNSTIKDFSNYFPVLSSIDKTLVKKIRHFQIIEPPKACLTISGYDSSKEPTSLNLEFIYEPSDWKLDYVQIMYHGSKDEFPVSATCPTRF